MTHFLDAVKSHYLRFSGHPLPHPVNYPELVPPGITSLDSNAPINSDRCLPFPLINAIDEIDGRTTEIQQNSHY